MQLFHNIEPRSFGALFYEPSKAVCSAVSAIRGSIRVLSYSRTPRPKVDQKTFLECPERLKLFLMNCTAQEPQDIYPDEVRDDLNYVWIENTLNRLKLYGIIYVELQEFRSEFDDWAEATFFMITSTPTWENAQQYITESSLSKSFNNYLRAFRVSTACITLGQLVKDAITTTKSEGINTQVFIDIKYCEGMNFESRIFLIGILCLKKDSINKVAERQNEYFNKPIYLLERESLLSHLLELE